MSDAAKTAVSAAPVDQPIDEKTVLAKYKELQSSCNQLINKITELEFDRNEHRLVEDTLKPLETTRRAYRLVGGVLVERTVGEILPAVTTNKENIQMVLDNLQKNMEAKQKETSDWKAKYNIKTQQEAQAMQRAQQQ
eukprot:CAMPEP_0171296396 /NCGR_PEP_ID=MMETSP0816-20121228/5050_1 /TAXON_ID=420281 /ORGANISM="Proboscia inermis, Strain CCAP1064/1" /LENGTH=136 /DNA_ID=CAMNT_0011769791 /DNA_START=31 /DNA_END=441 /DNA_ORIENTATION=-